MSDGQVGLDFDVLVRLTFGGENNSIYLTDKVETSYEFMGVGWLCVCVWVCRIANICHKGK